MATRETYNAKMRVYMLERYYALKLKYINQLGGKCAQCPETDPAKLQFDHRDPKTKLFGICAHLINRSATAIERELKKCQLLCVECHTKKSIREAGRVEARGTHGTLSSYRYCRCDLCRAAKSKSNQEQKRKRKTHSGFV